MHIGVTGDIDATNRQALGRFVERHTRASQQIVLDLKQSRLFREPGFHPLYYVVSTAGDETWTG